MSLDDYEQLSELGRGAFGAVYRARHRPSGTIVALKVLHEALPERARERFRRERAILLELQHPQIVGVLAASEAAAGRPWIAFEFVVGESLGERLRGGPLPIAEAVRITAAIARALDHAHRQGVVHRDVKPDNVLLGQGGWTRLADFGLAKNLSQSDAERLTRTGQLLGSPGYWAPEQAQGQLDQLGPATDVYGLGATLYAMLTGGPPFQADNMLGLLQAQDEGRLEAPSSLRPGISRPLDRACLEALARQPGERFASAGDLADALDVALASEERPAGALAGGPWLAGMALGGLLVGAALWLQRLGAEPSPGASPPPPPSVPSGPIDPGEPIETVERLIELEQLEDARAYVNTLLRERPDDPAVAFAQARVAFEEGDLPTAERELAVAAVAYPDDPRVHFRVGLVRYQRGDFAGAVEALRRAVALRPASVGQRRHLAQSLAELGQIEEAVEILETAEPADQSGETSYALGVVLERLGRLDEAGAAFARNLRLRPSHLKGHNMLGLVRYVQGRDLEALALWETCTELAPEDPRYWFNRGLVLIELRRGEEAQQSFGTADRLQGEPGWSERRRQRPPQR